MHVFYTYLSIVIALGLLVASLHLIPRLGPAGKKLSAALCRAPGLDGLIFLLTIAPLWAALAVGFRHGIGIPGFVGWLIVGAAAQVTVLSTWCRLHELAHRKELRGPRIVKSLNRAVGPWRNVLSVYWTALAVPLFFFVRIVELFVYPPLTWSIGLPKYNDADWVNITRHKFEGLVGGDRVWCLYCDWMTGVWSLGSEMLRNIESFWCPIQFGDKTKCENCKNDFPDIVNGWVPFDADITAAVAATESKYPGPHGVNSHFTHPDRTPLTIDGEKPEPENK
ncbi:MAG: hypothetical protein V3V20_12770 [Algisphaera sp.]